MEVIKVKAKVCHLSEEQMEAQEMYDLGDIAKSKHWVWRNIGIEVPIIYRIEEFDSKKSIIITYDEEKFLIQEPFDSLFDRWHELKRSQPDPEEPGRGVPDAEEFEDNDNID
jgi:hypothetical protein